MVRRTPAPTLPVPGPDRPRLDVFRRRDGSAEDRPPGSRPGRGQRRHVGGEDQEQLILAALHDLRDTKVREVMTPRVDVVGLPIPVHAADVARAVRQTGHSSFPVYDDDLDHLIGILFVNDLFRSGWELDGRYGNGNGNGGTNGSGSGEPEKPTPLDISRRLRQPYPVPESRFVLDVLADMRRDRRAFAVVVDEYGGVAGVLTVKDLLSALVGDLRDEFDPGGEPEIIRVDRTRWLVDGGASIDDVRDQVGVNVPEGEYVTIGGFLFDAFGHIPEEGERLTYDGWELRVAEMDKRRVAKVVVQAPDDSVTEDEPTAG
jgi:magnesium and cobalt transporter